MSLEHRRQTTADALKWLVETDTLTTKTVKRSVWEDLRCTQISDREIRVANHSYADPEEHTHVVGLGGEIITNCTCGHWTYRSEVCKHMLSVAMWFDDRGGSSQKTTDR